MGKHTEQMRREEARRRRFEQRIEEDCRTSGHARPATRRDFLARGLISGAATVFLPSIATILEREIRAQTAGCVIDTGSGLGAGKIPFLAIDQAGGANIAGSNVMVGKQGGQDMLLDPAGYAKLGLPAAIVPQTVGVDRQFGLAMHPQSALLRGLVSKTAAGTRANTNGFVIPARSENDTGNNPHNPIYGIARAGANGEFVATIGTQASDSGGNSAAPASQIVASLRPTKVSSRTEAMGLVGNGAAGFPDGRVAQASAVLTALKLGKITETQATKDLVQCGFDKTKATLNTVITPANLDPNVDTNLQAIFPGTELTQNADLRKAAAAMKVVINGFGGAGTIVYGGRDYHQNPRPDTDTKDFVVGQVIGASLEYAARLGKPLMVYVFSDGSVSANVNQPEDDGNGTTKFRWNNDDSQTAASFVLVYSPNGRPVLRNGAASQQLGFFKAAGSIDTASSPFANSVTQLAELVVLNYLALHGEEANFGTVLTNPGLGTGAAVAPYIAFNKIV